MKYSYDDARKSCLWYLYKIYLLYLFPLFEYVYIFGTMTMCQVQHVSFCEEEKGLEKTADWQCQSHLSLYI